ncbi:hypothetical protein C4G48_RS22705 [Vibrio parahaemolyticus]|uniref:hypothetical protein n=1 Tax=Vibrio parahaemolyticus TaxID=670 RepID=UPI00112358F3|nr:hypothetical protein [Vibrio parahaemolyticus]EHH1101780.1 hypothetical protein [Vibrio parahaemolyticus]EIT7136820.1 hypothetical protein [Vibrio parahaemolyticus]EIV8632181.1 hypothetical protein [Vibrio parahaemolyticus]EJG0980410.1 hypothetical protein [Vibrio parahaemolyticus]EJG1023978.1 hypothetical protein [Vibrio parahaemolyticus]
MDWNNNKLVMKKAAPGSIFAIFGALVVVMTVSSTASYSPKEYARARVSEEQIDTFQLKKKIQKMIKEDDPLWEKELDELLKKREAGVTPSIFVDNKHSPLLKHMLSKEFNKLRNEIATLSSNEQPKGTDSNQS